MRSRNVRQGIRLMHPNIQLILDNEIKELCRVLLELLSGINIVEESRSQNRDVLGCESGDGQWRDGSGLNITG